MKRGDLIRALEDAGCILQRHGKHHDLYFNPASGQQPPVPRHNEIDNALAKHIKKFLGLKY